jgi:hypothetical protein
MVFPKDENIAGVIHNLKKLKDAKQYFWEARVVLEKSDKLNDLSERKLWSECVQPVLKIVRDQFKELNLYGYIISFGSGKWKSEKSINTMIEGIYSTESDKRAIDEIVKELETVRQNLSKTVSPEQPTEPSGNKADLSSEKSAETEQENKDVKDRQEGFLEPKPPEFLQKLLWIKKYGRRHWKLVLLALLILLILSYLGFA